MKVQLDKLYGVITGDVVGSQVSEGDGEAFRLSGQTLPRDSANAAWPLPPTTRMPLFAGTIDALVSHQWTERRAKAVTGALRHWTQEEIGNLWKPPIEQASVNRHLHSGVGSPFPGQFEFWSAYDRL